LLAERDQLRQQRDELVMALDDATDILWDADRHAFDQEHRERVHVMRAQLEGLVARAEKGGAK
jgi:hypothetical protein